MPRLVFLGTGAAVPTKEDMRHDTATWLSYGKDCNLLVDCGEGAKYNLLRAGVTRKLHHIFLTHDHYDHLMGLTGLIAMLSLAIPNPPPLHIYGPATTLERVELLLGMVRSQADAKIEVELHLHSLTAGEMVPLTEVKVTAFQTAHREKPSLGYAFVATSQPQHKVTFTGDTRDLPDLINYAQDSTWLIANTNFAGADAERAARHGHLTTLQAAALAKEANIQRLFLQHLSPRYTKERAKLLDEARQIFAETYWAEDGETVG